MGPPPLLTCIRWKITSTTIVLFDKTGTLTKGSHRVTGSVASDGYDAELLALAATVESESEHPLARAIVAAANGPIPPAESIKTMSGRGAEGRVSGQMVTVGGPALLAERETTVPPRSRGWCPSGKVGGQRFSM